MDVLTAVKTRLFNGYSFQGASLLLPQSLLESELPQV